LGVATGVGLVGWQAVVGKELVLREPIYDDASACAFRVGGVVFVAAYDIEFVLVDAVGVDGEVDDARGVVRVDHRFLAAADEQHCDEG